MSLFAKDGFGMDISLSSADGVLVCAVTEVAPKAAADRHSNVFIFFIFCFVFLFRLFVAKILFSDGCYRKCSARR